MPLTLLLAESEVSSVMASGRSLQVRLSAACVESSGEPSSASPAVGFATGVSLQLQDFHMHGSSEPTIGRIRSGLLRVHEKTLRSCPLPGEFQAPVELELAFANGASLAVAAAGISVTFEGEPNFRESLAC